MSGLRDWLWDVFRQADHLLLGLCVAVNLFGIALIYSATRYDPTLHSYPMKQGTAMVIGIVLFFLLSQLDLETVLARWPWLLGCSLAFLSLLAIPGVGHSVGGNRSWIAFPLFSVQPAEIVKLTFTMLLARQIVSLQRSRGISHPLSVAELCGHAALFVGLIFAVSRDAGTALVYLAVFVAMLWAAGLHFAWFALGAVVCALAGSLLWLRLPEDNYWKMRLLVCLNHDLDPAFRGFQQTRSLLAVQSGKLWGMGYLRGNLTQAPYRSALPARHTDFIFSVCCEELGLMAAAALMLLLTGLILRCIHIAVHAGNPAFALIALGYAVLFLVQILLNIGMCLFLLPVIGLTLPFVSYGGSSLITAYAAMGILSGIRQWTVPDWLRESREDPWAEEG